MSDPSNLYGGINAVSTATDLRRQLHEGKARDRIALQAQKGGTPMERFLRSEYVYAAFAALVVFIMLYGSNPYIVQQQTQNYETARPNLKRVLLYSAIAGGIVAFGPMIAQKILLKK